MKQRISTTALAVFLGPALLPAGVAVAAQPSTAKAAQPTPNDIVIHGRGDGHGVGLPQDGALALGRAGKSAAQILSTFYPGTTLESARSARMHVGVWQDQTAIGSTQISLPDGGRIYGLLGHVAVPPGGLVDLSFSGAQWTARLATIPLGGGGRSIPRSLSDDPEPSPSPAAPTLTPASPTSAPSPTATATPSAPSASASASTPTPSVSASQDPTPAPGTSSGPAGTAAPEPSPTQSASTKAAVTPSHEPESATPSPVSTTDASAAIPETSVTGAGLDIVPTGTNGLTTVMATGRSYRGQVLTAPGELVNDVPLELYLRGLGEVLDPSWPQAGLQALVIAARTYALRDALGADDPGDHQHVNICATDACQVYLGAGVEYPQLTQAVEATQGSVLEWQGALAESYYSASAGGETATPSEGFGAGSSDVPYLTPVSYDDGGHDGWQRTVDLAAAATALNYPGHLSEIEVTTRGPSGRATAVMLHGTGGDVASTGLAVEAALGLPSTLFTTGFGIAAPQVAAATSSSVLPALTAASLGQVAVPVPVLAPVTAAVVPAAAAPAAPAAPPAGRNASAPHATASLFTRAPQPTPLGVIVWCVLLGCLLATAVVVGGFRLVARSASAIRQPGRHAAGTPAAAG